MDDDNAMLDPRAHRSRSADGPRINLPARLGEILLRDGLIEPEDLDQALTDQAGGSEWRLGSLLVQRGAIDDRALTEAIASQYRVDVVDLQITTPQADAVMLLPRDAALQLRALPVEVRADHVLVAVSDPPTRQLRVAVQRCLDRPIRLAVCAADELTLALERWYARGSFGVASDTDTDSGSLADTGAPPTAGGNAPRAEPLVGSERPSGGTPPRSTRRWTDDRVVSWLLAEATRRHASAAHVDSSSDCVRVAFRIDGAMEPSLRLPPRAGSILERRLLAAANLTAPRDEPVSGRISAQCDDGMVRADIHAACTTQGQKIVVLLDAHPDAGRRFEDLGLSASGSRLAREAITTASGLVLVVLHNESLRSLVTATLVDEVERIRRTVAIAGRAPDRDSGRVLHLPATDNPSMRRAMYTAACLDIDAVIVGSASGHEVAVAAVDGASEQRMVVVLHEAADTVTAVADLCRLVGGLSLAGKVRLVLAVDGTPTRPEAAARTITDEMCQALLDPDVELAGQRVGASNGS